MTSALLADASDALSISSSPGAPLDPAMVGPAATALMARDQWCRAELLELQRQQLREALGHAASTSPYYRDVVGRVAMEGPSLDILPVLTKRVLMDQWDRIVTDRRLRLRDVEAHLASERAGELLFGEYRACATGGTTGERAVIVYDRSAWVAIVANMFRWVRILGAAPDTRVVGIGAPTPLHLTNRAFAELRPGRNDAPRLSVVTPLPRLVAALNEYNPEFVVTYPSFARRLAEEQDAGRLHIQPRTFCLAAEVLTPDLRGLIRRTWGATALDTYGTTEGGLLGTECSDGVGIHLAEDINILEVVDAVNRPVPPGTPGSKVLLTTLFNKALPLIRYEISDIVTMAEGPCRCGMPYARLASIDGRREDYLGLPARDGAPMQLHAGRLRMPLSGVAGLRQFQIVRMADGLRVRISIREDHSPGDVAASATRAVRQALECAGASPVPLIIDVVEHIQRTGTGAKEVLVAAC